MLCKKTKEKEGGAFCKSLVNGVLVIPAKAGIQ